MNLISPMHPSAGQILQMGPPLLVGFNSRLSLSPTHRAIVCTFRWPNFTSLPIPHMAPVPPAHLSAFSDRLLLAVDLVMTSCESFSRAPMTPPHRHSPHSYIGHHHPFESQPLKHHRIMQSGHPNIWDQAINPTPPLIDLFQDQKLPIPPRMSSVEAALRQVRSPQKTSSLTSVVR